MRIALIGGTGFLGGRVASRLAERARPPSGLLAIVREPARAGRLGELGFEIVRGDLSDERSLRSGLADCDTVVTTTTLKLGYTPTLVSALAGTAVVRGVFVSTTGIFTDLELREKTTVLVAEDLIRNSGIAYTLLRPTMVYGGAGDINLHRLLRFVSRWGFFPVLGSPDHLQQPVHVDDVADAVVAAVFSPAARNRSYNLSGKAPLAFSEMLDAVERSLGRRVVRPRIPYAVALGAAYVLGLLPKAPYTAAQVRRNNMDKSCDHSDAARDLGFAPIDFETGIARQVADMRAAKLL